MEKRFEAWCEQRWTVQSDWTRIPCAVHVSPACKDQVLAACPDGGGIDFIGIAACYYDELAASYWTGQVRHPLQEPLRGEWHVLLYLGMIYIDVQPHPLASQERRLFRDSV